VDTEDVNPTDRQVLIFLLVLLYVIWSVGLLMLGIHSSEQGTRDCCSPMARYEYAVPAFRLGCWLGQPPEGGGEGAGCRRRR
jgi:hypothetical protein